uniref:Uncharacterized protein n=1 Tax=Anopheles stephensi TaxID=30069 RepID=A0A182YD89_ANOST
MMSVLRAPSKILCESESRILELSGMAASRRVDDLFEDLRDGHNLLSLLEVLSGEHLPREKGKMRFHMLQNAQMALDFLRYKKIKLVNIRAEDIVDGNPKLTLGLIWTIILHFQVGGGTNDLYEELAFKGIAKQSNEFRNDLLL